MLHPYPVTKNLCIGPNPIGNEIIGVNRPNAEGKTWVEYILSVDDQPGRHFDKEDLTPRSWYPLWEIGEWPVATLHAILLTLDDQLSQGRHVYLHCHAGAYRAPAVAALYLTAKGTPTQRIKNIFEWDPVEDLLQEKRIRPGTTHLLQIGLESRKGSMDLLQETNPQEVLRIAGV